MARDLAPTPWPPHDDQSQPQIGHGAPVSFDFRDTDIRTVLRMLATVSRTEIIATDDVHGHVTLKLDEVPWDEALEIIGHTLDLTVERAGNLIRVSSAAKSQEEQEARERSETLHTDMYRLRFAHAAYVAELLTGERTHVSADAAADSDSAIAPNRDEMAETPPRRGGPPQALPPFNRLGLLSQRGSAIADEPSNTLIVTDVQRGLDSARQVISEIDRPAPQVQIESKIVETSISFDREMGIQWGYRYARSAATGNPTGLNFPGSVVVGGATPQPGPNGTTTGLNSGIDPITGAVIPFIADFPQNTLTAGSGSAVDLVLGSVNQSQLLDLRLDQLESTNRVKVISRPRIITRNNQEAVIKSVQIVRVRLPQSTILGGFTYGYARQVFATERIEVGVLLRVRPQVSADGYILLDLVAVSSTLLNQTVDNIPLQDERATESHVLLRDGQTLVVGGVYRMEDQFQVSGFPYLSRILGLGWLFGGISHQNRRENLMIFITPHRVDTGGAFAGEPLPPASQLWLNRNSSGG